jgi:hypothetical protein
MPHKRIRLALLLPVLLAVTSCDLPAIFPSSETSKNIARHFETNGQKSINLSVAVPRPWEKVCILGPYMRNEDAKAALGFEWDVESKTEIKTNEGISLLLFVQGGEVVEYVQHPRHLGDFTSLTMRCFPREKAIFVQRIMPKKGWAGLFPENEA